MSENLGVEYMKALSMIFRISSVKQKNLDFKPLKSDSLSRFEVSET